MLSKSAARAFFIGGTLLTGVAFAALTVHTHQTVPEQSNEANLTPAVERGHGIWTDENCMGCHTLLGEGAYYAPELTKVVERRGKLWIKTFIKDPEAMFPGRRRMVKYDFTDAQIDDLIAFLEWVGNIDANGFPADPPYAPAPQAVIVGGRSLDNAPEVFKSLCTACHMVGGKGGNVGPPLDDISARYDAASLDAWLVDPQAIKPGTAMPKLPLTPEHRKAISTFLLETR
ncbi:MAG: c-type cytochrome [Myxococcales bacterium]|nr:c-type cytochrome [Myxococcales bacterium]